MFREDIWPVRTIKVVMIQALGLDPLEFHRVVPANEGTHAVFAFCGRVKCTESWRRTGVENEMLQPGGSEAQCQRSNS